MKRMFLATFVLLSFAILGKILGGWQMSAIVSRQSGRLQLRWEVFNVTNHPSYGLPTTNLLSRDFGTIRSTVSAPRQM